VYPAAPSRPPPKFRSQFASLSCSSSHPPPTGLAILFELEAERKGGSWRKSQGKAEEDLQSMREEEAGLAVIVA